MRMDWGYDPTPALTLPQRPRWRRNIGHLHVKIIDCEDLADVDNSLLSGSTDPFITVPPAGYSAQPVAQRPGVRGSANPSVAAPPAG